MRDRGRAQLMLHIAACRTFMRGRGMWGSLTLPLKRLSFWGSSAAQGMAARACSAGLLGQQMG